MSLTRPQLNALAELLAESLRARAGDVLTPSVIDERARNIAQTLSVAYRVQPVGAGCESEDGEHCDCPGAVCCICERVKS